MTSFSINGIVHDDIIGLTPQIAADIRTSEIRERALRISTTRFSTTELILLAAVVSGAYNDPDVVAQLTPEELATVQDLLPAARMEAVEAIRLARAYTTALGTIEAIVADPALSDAQKIQAIDAVTV